LDKQIETSKKVLEEATKQTSAFYWNTTLPRQLLIVTSWRSGSTFLGEILANHPAIFQHYEPLTYFGAKQIRGGKEGIDAVGHLKSLLHCKCVISLIQFS
jgi:carbohydrate 6-sulfotransferase 6